MRSADAGGAMAAMGRKSSTPGRETFAGMDLRQATFDQYFFKMCDFRGANLQGASLRGVCFAGCDLSEVDFRWADLRDARFTFVLTHDPDYGRTDVTGARWEGARLEGATFERVIGWVEE
jgi:uncharacterized protein YjbI with pentapeptide repeats